MARFTVCSVVDCPIVFRGSGKCPAHAAIADAARGNRHERGYGYQHVLAVKAVTQGATHCAVCGEPFTPENPATGGHLIAIRNGGTSADGYQPECRRCNYGWERTGR